MCGLGRECSVKEDGMLLMPLSLVPNSQRLVPKVVHGAHELLQGKLLEPAGVTIGEEDPVVSVCGECMHDLRRPQGGPLKYALANRMWIWKSSMGIGGAYFSIATVDHIAISSGIHVQVISRTLNGWSWPIESTTSHAGKCQYLPTECGRGHRYG